KRERNLTPVGAGGSLADMMAKLADKKVSELPLLVKADVQGSAEAIVGSLEKLGTDEVRARIILSGAGGINESDVMLAKGAGAPGRPGPYHPQGRGGARAGHAQDAQAVQGRSRRSHVRHGVRHGVRRVPGYPTGRLHRVLHRRRGQAVALTGARSPFDRSAYER